MDAGGTHPGSGTRKGGAGGWLSSVPEVLGLRQTVHRVTLFGSLARGAGTFHGDIDLMVVEETDQRFLDRLGGASPALQPRLPWMSWCTCLTGSRP
ncbi:MAG TPA: hypothetical protein DCM14_06775 [Clostridiales bacterium UBA8153]|nr:hypothetical protein [Clostridiales bacterium UBA8153]